MKTAILNLTQHPATPEQKLAGVIDFGGEGLDHLKDMLTFNEPPSLMDMRWRAMEILALVQAAADELQPDNLIVMLGGAPYFMPVLTDVLIANGVRVAFSFSERVSSETINENGEVIKTSKFVHKDFVELQ